MLFYLYLDRKQCRIALKQPIYLAGRRHRVLKWAPFVRRIIFVYRRILYFIGNFTPKNFWFQHAFVVSSVYHRQRPEEASKHDMYPWKWNHPEDVCVFAFTFTILAATCEARVNGKHHEWYRCPAVKSSNTSRTDWPPLYAFWVDLLLPWVNLFLPWAICFCHEWFAFAMSDLLLSWQLNAFRDRTCNMRAKGNHVKAVRECSRIFRYERPTSRRVSGVFRDCNHRINISRSRVSICHGCSVTCLNIDWTLEWRAGIWINLRTLD